MVAEGDRAGQELLGALKRLDGTFLRVLVACLVDRVDVVVERLSLDRGEGQPSPVDDCLLPAHWDGDVGAAAERCGTVIGEQNAGYAPFLSLSRN